jgi:peptide/nickel transport system ATP-binding protein
MPSRSRPNLAAALDGAWPNVTAASTDVAELRRKGPDDQPLLQTQQVAKTFLTKSVSGRAIHTQALSATSISIWPGRSVGIAGESGSGKTTLLRLMLGIEKPTDGKVSYRGRSLDAMDRQQRRQYRSAVQAVFQNPVSSFDPREPVWKIITEPMWAYSNAPAETRKERAAQLLQEVGLSAAYMSYRRNHVSGGEAQRIAIARALSCGPEIVTLDEPVTSLDVPVRGRILELLAERAESDGVTYVVVTHDLTPLRWLTDFTYIFYRGELVEAGTTSAILEAPLHPYTELLVRASLRMAETRRDGAGSGVTRDAAEEQWSAESRLEAGCQYRDRCPLAVDACRARQVLQPVGDEGHRVRCHVRAGLAGSAMADAAQEGEISD